ncbi:class I adenylate-forming enzyme family protein [Pseudonocardia ailaonensis]
MSATDRPSGLGDSTTEEPTLPGRSGQNLADAFRFWAHHHRSSRNAVRFDDVDFTWQDLDVLTDSLAAGLVAAGVGKGDPVAVLLDNRPEFIQVVLAAFKIGAIVVPLNVRATAGELTGPLAASGARIVVTEAALRPRLDLALTCAHGLRCFSVDDGQLGDERFEDLARPGERPPRVEISPSDTALLCFTSGTTQEAKGVLLSHGGILFGGEARALAAGITWRDTLLLAQPLAFTGGVTNYLREGMVTGATTIIAGSLDPDYLMTRIATERVSIWPCLPVVYEAMMRAPAFQEADLSSLRVAMVAGSMVSRHLLNAFAQKGVRLTQAYGQTETSGAVIALNPEDALDRLGTAGKPIPHVEVRIVDASGRTLSAGTEGEIQIRCPYLMSGYLGRPDLTAEVIVDGWLRTGDTGVIDDDGHLTVVGRLKDMLISGGLNVYIADVEDVLSAFPGLADFCVIPVPDDRWGEVGMIVVDDLTGVDTEHLRAFCLEHLADYKRPRYIASAREPLPRTLGGKILKRVLRERLPAAPATAVRLK